MEYAAPLEWGFQTDTFLNTGGQNLGGFQIYFYNLENIFYI